MSGQTSTLKGLNKYSKYSKKLTAIPTVTFLKNVKQLRIDFNPNKRLPNSYLAKKKVTALL